MAELKFKLYMFVLSVNVLTPRLAFSTTCGQSPRLQLNRHRIMGGHEAIPGSIPWIVMLTELGDQVCGGSIIGDRLILTAAHCFDDRVSKTVGRWKVIAGKHHIDKRDPQQIEFSVQKIIIHASYNADTVANDIAILVLQNRIIYNDYIKPICLPTGQNYHIGQRCIASGWGDTRGTGNYDVLNQVEVGIISDSDCVKRDWYGNEFIPRTTFCAGNYPHGGKDSCGGDSGGPFVCKFGNSWIQMGVTSWGIECGYPRWPGIYTDLTQYISWIRSTARTVGLLLAP